MSKTDVVIEKAQAFLERTRNLDDPDHGMTRIVCSKTGLPLPEAVVIQSTGFYDHLETRRHLVACIQELEKTKAFLCEAYRLLHPELVPARAMSKTEEVAIRKFLKENDV